MQFVYPLWIFAGLICCTAIIFFLHLLQKRRQVTLEKFASAQLLGRLTRHVSSRRRRFKHVLLLLAIFLLFVALARPQFGFTWVEVKRKGIDILFALDTSRSMLAEDTKPNRLQRARLGIMDFVGQLEGDRVGLMPFAGVGYLMCPLTLDYDAFNNSLTTVTTDLIPVGGTNIEEVITGAEQILKNDANHKILILLTDGENLQGDALGAAQKAKENGMTIYTVGVGTPGGELIPLPGKDHAGFVKDEAGKYVTSKLDEKSLTAIAEATEGIYVPLGNGGEGLEQIYQQKLELIPKEELAERRHKVPIDRFGWPLTAAIILLILEYLVPERKSNHALSIPNIITVGRRMKKQLTPMLIVMLALAASAPRAMASEAEEAYGTGDYLKASELYSKALKEHPNDPKLHYNMGTVAYKNNLYDEAIASFSEALKSEDLSLQEKAYYNRGNTHFQKGLESQQATPQATVEQWQQALESYDGALQLSPEDTSAIENRQFVAQKLEELQKQMEEQQQDQNDQQDNKQEQEDQQQGDQQQGDQQQTDDSKSSEKDRTDDQSPEDNPDNGEREQDQQQNPNDTQPQNEKQQENSDNLQNQENSAADQEAEKQRDIERRELGKMTKEEAENLLNALKNEEGELNFVPRRQQDTPIRRDW